MEKEEGSHRILVPSEQSLIDDKEEKALQSLRNMLHFLLEFNASLETRCEEIKADKNMKRRLELQHKKVRVRVLLNLLLCDRMYPSLVLINPFLSTHITRHPRAQVPEHMLFNIAHEHKASENLAEGRVLELQLRDRIATYEKQQSEHVSMAQLMHKQHTLVNKKIEAATPGTGMAPKGLQVWSYKDDEKAAADATTDKSRADRRAAKGSKAGSGDDDEDDGFAPPASPDAKPELSHDEKLAAAEKLRIQKEKDRVRRSHGLETDDEIREREEAEERAAQAKQAIEDEKIMAIDFMLAEKKEEEDRIKARLEQDVYDDLQGVLHQSEYETTSYR